MKRFESRDIFKAYEFAEAGGQALHVMDAEGPLDVPAGTVDVNAQHHNPPACFRRSKLWGHLIDMDRVRLVKTAIRLGVKVIVVGRHGRQGQHVDLCGKPLERAIEECERG